jgi:hypothetical protein
MKICEDASGNLPPKNVTTGMFVNTVNTFAGSMCLRDVCKNPIHPKGDPIYPRTQMAQAITTGTPFAAWGVPLPVSMKVTLEAFDPSDVGKTCPKDYVNGSVHVDFDVPAIEPNKGIPLLVMAGVPLSLPDNKPMAICGPKKNEPCPDALAPKFHLFYSTCTPKSDGFATLRVLHLWPTAGPLTFEVVDDNKVVKNFALDYGQASEYFDVPLENGFDFAQFVINAIDSNKKTVASFQGGLGGYLESFTQYPRDNQCGSALFIRENANEYFMSENPGMCSPWNYGLPMPKPCE